MLLEFIILVLVAFWMVDAVITIKVLRKDPEKEVNLLLKDIHRQSPKAFLTFKIIDLAVVIGILYLLSINYMVTAQTVLLIFIYIYAQVDWHNYRIWKKMQLKGAARKRALKKELKEIGINSNRNKNPAEERHKKP